jgi:hypothetical protein
MRVFYAIYPREPRVGFYLDAIRLLANPREKNRSHVTVRGPYRQRYNVSALSAGIDGARIEVGSAGAFWGARQSTVYLSCSAEEMRLVWYKPDYGYNPHLTVYDGEARSFAEKLVLMLGRHDLKFVFTSTPLMPIVSVRGQSSLDLLTSVRFASLSRTVGERLSLEKLLAIDDATRLRFIDRVCSAFATEQRSTVGRRRLSRAHEVSRERIRGGLCATG